MKARLIVLLTFALSVIAASAISYAPAKPELIKSVATLICPAKNGDASGEISLGSTRTKSAVIDKKNRILKKSKSTTIPLLGKATVVAGDAATALAVTSKTSTWSALAQCNSSAGDLWFVGGAADVTSLGYFQFTNENLGEAIIDLELWSEDGSESTRTLTIPARSTKNYSLTTFMPGKKLTAFHVVSRSGLVTAHLFDERRKGLTAYGGDYVAPNAAPSTNLSLVGIPGPKFAKKFTITSQKIRLFVPGESDALIQVNYISPSGVFAPIGLDSLRVPSQKVVEVDLANLPKDKLFALEISSSEPVIGSVLTRVQLDRQREFTWTSSVEAIQGEKFALPKQRGYISILTKSEKVSFTVIKARGKKTSVTIPVDSMVVWKVPTGAREIQFAPSQKPIHLALSLRSASGVATTSLAPVQTSELTTLPIVDSGLYVPTSS